ncbi:MAG: SLBB domain-containing protein, partial [Verrucomicrobiales bacterium]|nr:SLBB domain-containing protein [Verrucomicrobiales bacterium]
AADPIREALQRGLLAEEAQRDLAAAADAYAEAVRLGDEERSFVATALFRLAEAQRRLGRTNEAAVGYRRLLRDFGEMTNLTAIALSRDTASPQVPSGPALLQAEREKAVADLQSLKNRISELEALRTLVTDSLSGTSGDDASSALAAANPTPELNRLRAEFHQSEARLAALRNDFGPEHPDRVKEQTVLMTLQQQLQKEMQGILQSLALRAASLNRELEQQQRRVQSLSLQRAQEEASTLPIEVVHDLDLVLALQRAQEEASKSGSESTTEDGRGTPEDYLRQEIAIAELQVKRLAEMNAQGVAGTEAVLTARREVLALKRQLAGLPPKDLPIELVPKSPGTGNPLAGTTDPSFANATSVAASTNAIAVIGAVARPGMIPIPEGRTLDLVELIARCGDLTRTANRNRIRVYRGEQTLEIRLDDAMSKRFDLQPGDRVEVRETVF